MNVIIIGKLVTFLIQSNHWIGKILKRYQYLYELWKCDYCLGFWVYLFLGRSIFEVFPNKYINLIASSAVSTFVAHIFTLGLKLKFGWFEDADNEG